MSVMDLERKNSAKHELQVIDCDIHPAMTSWKEIHPYLEKRWINHLAVYGSHLRHAFSEALSHPRMSPDASKPIAPETMSKLASMTPASTSVFPGPEPR